MAQRTKLSSAEMQAFVDKHPGWQIVTGGAPDALERTFAFATYADGVAFTVAIAVAADRSDHHPDLHLGYRKVRVLWSTHDAGGVSAVDTTMAEETDATAARHGTLPNKPA
jgi:4a-hydroxytetrahydrobiopterin dehydratase